MRAVRVICLTLTLLLIAVPAWAAETLLSGNYETSHYNGPDLKISSVQGNSAIMIGGYGGDLINRTFFLGHGGYILLSRLDAPVGGGQYINFAYYGLMVEYVLNSDELIHFAGNVLIGPGYVIYGPADFDFSRSEQGSLCWVIEPGATAVINVTESFRAGIGLSYRLVSGSNISGLSDDDLSGLSVNLFFKFGEF